MDKFIQHDKILMNGRSRILYKQKGSNTLYIKHKGQIIYFSQYKKNYMKKYQKGGVITDFEPVSVLDCRYIDEANGKGKIRDNFDRMFEDLMTHLTLERYKAIFDLNDCNKGITSYTASYIVTNKNGQKLLPRSINGDIVNYNQAGWDNKGKHSFYYIEYYCTESEYIYTCKFIFDIPLDYNDDFKNTIAQKCFKITNDDVYKTYESVLMRYLKLYQPNKIFISENVVNNKKYYGYLFLHDNHVIYFRYSNVNNDKPNDKCGVVELIVSFIYYHEALDEEIHEYHTWTQIYDKNLDAIKLQAILSSIKPKASDLSHLKSAKSPKSIKSKPSEPSNPQSSKSTIDLTALEIETIKMIFDEAQKSPTYNKTQIVQYLSENCNLN